jgi:hypothetical protein
MKLLLYKYVDEGGVDAIVNSRLKVSLPSKFNDVFEMMPSYVGQYRRQHVKQIAKKKDAIRESYNHMLSRGLFVGSFKQYKSTYRKLLPKMVDGAVTQATTNVNARAKGLPREMDKHIGLICLSEKRDNLLMWAHYADSHRGLVLGYDMSHSFFSEMKPPYRVQYERNRRAIDLASSPDGPERTEQIMSLLYVKSDDWRYEQEWRFILRLDGLEKVTTGGGYKYYLNVPRTTLKEVIIGCRAEDGFVNKVRTLLHNDYSNSVRLLESDVHPSSYSLIFKSEQGSEGTSPRGRVDAPHR